MQSITKTFKVLEAFSIEQPERSFTEIVEASGLGRTNTHNILKTLVALNCLSQTHTGGLYRVGPKLFELGSLYPPTCAASPCPSCPAGRGVRRYGLSLH
jgi:DNA-binding IclR family transcriptional regulator